MSTATQTTPNGRPLIEAWSTTARPPWHKWQSDGGREIDRGWRLAPADPPKVFICGTCWATGGPCVGF